LRISVNAFSDLVSRAFKFSDRSDYVLCLKTARTIADFGKRDFEPYFTEVFKLVEDVA
jgi:hypothetical protein